MHVSPSVRRLLCALLACFPFAGLFVFGTNVSYGWALGLSVVAVLISHAALQFQFKWHSKRQI